MPSPPNKINGFAGPTAEEQISFRNLINVPELQNLLEVSYAATGMPSGIIDAKNGEVYAGAGWQDICVKFHRVHPETLKNCIKSDTAIVKNIKSGTPFKYKCANGLWDIGIPIYCDKMHLATFFLGQFHFTDEEVDIDFFLNQADRYGFEKTAYIDALQAVPRFSQEKVEEILKYNVALAAFLSEMASRNLAQRRELALRTEAERNLGRVQSYLANVIDSMPSMLIGVDTQGVVTFWNHGAEKATGISRSSAVGRPLGALLPSSKDITQYVQEAVRSRSKQENPQRGRTGNGRMHYDDVTVFPLVANGVEGAVIRMDDVTDRVNLEQFMIQSEKMMSVGGLAAGMAHEINNPLAAMLVSRHNIETRCFRDSPQNEAAARECGTTMDSIRQYLELRGVPKLLDMIRESGERAAIIIGNMLRFSRKSEKNFGRHDVSALLDAALELAANDYDLKKKYDFKKMEIRRLYAPEPVLAHCEPTEIQQVFLNILKNGAEAMAEKEYQTDSPRFTLETRTRADMAEVRIEDNGPGMNEETRKRVLEPFFSTKSVGKGTGLGLSVSYFIVTDQHEGRMDVESEPGNWTRFTIMLPSRPDKGGQED